MNDCCSKKVKEYQIAKCPRCDNNGETVSSYTVSKMVLEQSVVDEKKNYNLCYNPDCEVTYYNDLDNNIILIDQIKVPIWYKKDANPRYICYCSKVTDTEIIEAIKNNDCSTVKEVVANTNAMNISKCRDNSPTGKCCSRQIKELILKHKITE